MVRLVQAGRLSSWQVTAIQPDWCRCFACPHCLVTREERTGQTVVGHPFTHHVCPHHNVVVVWEGGG